MQKPGSPFTARALASSKGGRTDLAEIFGKGTTIVAVLPAEPTAAHFDALQLRYPGWLLTHFFNVYLVEGSSPQTAEL